MRQIIRLSLATLLLVGTCTVAAFGDGSDPMPCNPKDPTCIPPPPPERSRQFADVPVPTLVQMR